MHCVALSIDGKLYSWGCNDDMALGREGEEDYPAPITTLEHEFIVDVACGDSITLALTKQGTVYSWGTFRDSRGVFGHSVSQTRQKEPALIAELKDVIGIACGTNHAAALTANDKIYTWGVGEQGQLCRKIMSRHTYEASLKPRAINFKPFKKLPFFKGVYCGSYHTFLLQKEGSVYACGLNNHGQLGIGPYSPEDNFNPYLVEALEGKDVVQLAAGEHHSMALTSGGIILF